MRKLIDPDQCLREASDQLALRVSLSGAVHFYVP